MDLYFFHHTILIRHPELDSGSRLSPVRPEPVEGRSFRHFRRLYTPAKVAEWRNRKASITLNDLVDWHACITNYSWL